MNSPFFSVVIPLYNKEPHIGRAVSSVLNQTFKGFEIIIINDASTDGSTERLKSFKDSRIRLFHRNKPGPGGYAARNLGIKLSRSNWVTFLDADDEWMSDHLSNLHSLIIKYPEYNFFSSARSSIQEGKLKKDRFSLAVNKPNPIVINLKTYLKYAIKGMRAVGTNSVCFNKESPYVNNLFPEGRTNRSGDLYAWVLLLAREGSLVWSPHIASISHRNSANMVSKTAVASIDIFYELVDFLSPIITNEEKTLLKKYVNRLIKPAWSQQKRNGEKLGPVGNYYYWGNDVLFCLRTQLVSIMPNSLITGIKKLRSLFAKSYCC